jgi:hypothetical protein
MVDESRKRNHGFRLWLEGDAAARRLCGVRRPGINRGGRQSRLVGFPKVTRALREKIICENLAAVCCPPISMVSARPFEVGMTVLSDYARLSYKTTKEIEEFLDAAMNSTSREEFRWKFSEALRRLKELNARGDQVVPSQAFVSQ